MIINWKPDRTKKKPVYIQIVEFIESKITTGQWPIGTLLPPQRKLSELFGVNRSTIVSAMDELRSKGLITGKGKSGTRIFKQDSTKQLKTPHNWQAYIEQSIHYPNSKTLQQINKLDFSDHNILRLSSGEISPDFFPKEEMKTIIKEIADEVVSFGYTESLGLYALRKEISKHLEQYNIHTTPESILIVSGALQAIQLIALGMLQRGSTVLLEKPSYLYSINVMQSLEMRRMGIDMDENGIIPKDLIVKNPKHNPSILYTIPCFHNPTNRVMSLDRRKELMDVCLNEKIPIIEDDVYRDLWIDGPPPPPLKSFDTNGQVLYVGSISKSLSPGLRIGWVVGPEPVIQRLGDIKMQTDYGSSSVSQMIVAKWFEKGLYQKHMDNMRKELKKRRDFTLAALNKHLNGLAKWETPTGGYYIWIKLVNPINDQSFFDLTIQNGVLLYPGYLYGESDSANLRLSYSYAPYKDLEEGIKKLGDLLRSLQ